MERGQRVDAILKAHSEAESRLERFPAEDAHLGLGGLTISAPAITIDDGVEMRRLEHAPMWSSPSGALGRNTIWVELVLKVPFVGNEDTVLSTMWTMVAMLRLAAGGQFLAAAISDHAWDTIDGATADRAPRVVGTEVAGPSWWSNDAVAVTEAEAEWVGDTWMACFTLRADRQFHFALECYSGSFVEPDARMAASKVWAGIECLIDVNSELRFRLAAIIASTLMPPGATRLELFQRVQKLYDVRSKVVHGGNLPSTDVVRHIEDAQGLLADLLRHCLALGRVPSRGALEAVLFGVPSPPQEQTNHPD